MPGVEVIELQRRHLLLGLQVDQHAHRHPRRGRRVDLSGPRGRGVAVDRQARVAEDARGVGVGVVGAGRVGVQQDRRLLGFFARRFAGVVLAGVVLVGVVGFGFAAGVVVVVVFPSFGVIAVSGIFGGLTVAQRQRRFRASVSCPASRRRRGVAGVVAGGRGRGAVACATVVVTTGALRRRLCSAPRSRRGGAQHEHRRRAEDRRRRAPARRAEAAGRAGAALQAPVLPGGHRAAAAPQLRTARAGCGRRRAAAGAAGARGRPAARRRWRLPVRRSGRRIDERRGHWLRILALGRGAPAGKLQRGRAGRRARSRGRSGASCSSSSSCQ